LASIKIESSAEKRGVLVPANFMQQQPSFLRFTRPVPQPDGHKNAHGRRQGRTSKTVVGRALHELFAAGIAGRPWVSEPGAFGYFDSMP
jgi:hypothetical protein